MREPIAVIGLACRFPGGADSIEGFWDLLRAGRDAIGPVPASRWDIRKFYDPSGRRPGKMYVSEGGFLDQSLEHFDPLFFGISPREAEALDPQQRLLLEVAFEAIEDAGLILASLRRSNTGVFIGGFCLDNMMIQLSPAGRSLIDANTATSCTMALLANRLSHTFDLRGPSITVDTACSSSLVATHLACGALWNGETEMALVGGVNTMLRPEFPAAMSAGRFLSPHGRCRAFDAGAAGYARGEGAAIVVLKRLSDAVRDRDRVYAVIRATGVNQDGRTPGIAFPNGESQLALMRQVYGAAGIDPACVSYIEAHGTGTEVGDRTEMDALHRFFGEYVGCQQIPVGSVKTNLGHLEAAAGIAGLIKAVLCLHYRHLVPSLHFDKPSPRIAFDAIALRVQTRSERWEAMPPRTVSVNSFGYGGTNAHAVLQERTAENDPHALLPDPSVSRRWRVPVSGRSEQALREVAGRLTVALTRQDERELPTRDVVFTLRERRNHLSHRAVMTVASRQQLISQLNSLSQGVPTAGAALRVVDEYSPAPVALVFTGMGPQWQGMGRGLEKSDPRFADALSTFDRVFREECGWSIREQMLQPASRSRMHEPLVAQCANFALQFALTELLRDEGLRPAAVLGHSVGEVAAAWAAGALDLQDAIRVSHARASLQQSQAGSGGMLAVAAPASTIAELLAGDTSVELAAVNAPRLLTYSGNRETLERLAAMLMQRDIFARMLAVDVPYHSAGMDGLLQPLALALADIAPRPPTTPFYSTVTGERADGAELGADYWPRNVRQPVQFSAAVSAAHRDGMRVFLQVGPHPVLRNALEETLERADPPPLVLAMLRRAEDEQVCVEECLADLEACGVPLSPSTEPGPSGLLVSLPTYPWQRSHFWRESSSGREDRLGHPGHAFLQHRLAVPVPTWEVEFTPGYFPFVEHHRVQGSVVMPGTAFLEAGLALLRDHLGAKIFRIADFRIHRPLLFDDSSLTTVCTQLDTTSRRYTVSSRRGPDEPWELHASGRLATSPESDFVAPSIDPRELRAGLTPLDTDLLYASLERLGLRYGPAFRNIRELYSCPGQILARLALQPADAAANWIFHPALLDSALQAALGGMQSTDRLYLPTAVEGLVLAGNLPSDLWVHGRIRKRSDRSFEGDFEFFSDEGLALGRIHSFSFRALEPAAARRQHLEYELGWHRVEAAEPDLQPGAEAMVLWDALAAGDCRRPAAPGLAGTVPLVDLTGCAVEDVAARLRGALDGIPGRHIILCLDHIDFDSPAVTSARAPRLLLAAAIAIHEAGLDGARFDVVTRNARSVLAGDKVRSLGGAAAGALALVIHNELGIPVRMIDIDQEPATCWEALRSLPATSEDLDLAVRDGRVYSRRLHRQPQGEGRAAGEVRVRSTAEHAVELRLESPGSPDALYFAPAERRGPLDNEIEVAVRSTALNFKDVLKVYGQLPDEILDGTYFGHALGHEIAGVVTRAGPGVRHLAPGDEVIGPTPGGGFRSFVTLDSRFFARKPASLGFHQAPLMIGYLTAWHGLVNVAALRPKERVLIHYGTGGVGIPAIQIARHRGAQILATAGTPEKREFLRALGVAHVYDSRTLAFAEHIRADVGSLDVVLNAMPGDAMLASLELLAPYGRFVELGKRDIAENQGLPLRVFNRNITYAGVDIDRMFLERPELILSMTDQMLPLFDTGVFEPVPVHDFPAAETAEAFRLLAQARHIGKVTVSWGGDVAVLDAGPDLAERVAGRWLVTGGTHGFGLRAARHLADLGATHLHLVSRSGVNEQNRAFADACRVRGIAVEIEALDVADAAAVDRLMGQFASDGIGLTGIVHAAMVLADGPIGTQDGPRFLAAWRAKVEGGWNLHRASLTLSLQYFIVFSSISALIGNPAQANYVAANAWLDALAHARRARGLPATTINWGALGESGAVARDPSVRLGLESQGIRPLSDSEALEHLTQVIRRPPIQVGVFDLDWEVLASTGLPVTRTVKFSELVGKRRTSGLREDLVAELWELAPAQRLRHVLDRIIEAIVAVTRQRGDTLKGETRISTLGMDSLMVVELANRLEQSTGFRFPVVELLSGPKAADLAWRILGAFQLEAEDLDHMIEGLTEAELDALLAEGQPGPPEEATHGG